MHNEQKLNLIRSSGIIAIMRANNSEQLLEAAQAIFEGGVRVIEVTLTTPGALKVISKVAEKFGDNILFGAGTVLDRESARAAIIAGADFIVSPNLNVEVITVCLRYGIPVFPGCFTPTEVLTAWQSGASMVKLFPADVGGPSMIKAIRSPLPQVEIIPVGGVDLNTAADFIRNGASALGVGGSLINQKVLDDRELNQITRLAKKFLIEVAKGRSQQQID